MRLPAQSGQQPLRFTLRIGRFSQAVTSGGTFSSHVFRNSQSGHKWSLGVRFHEGGATEIRLHQHRGGGGGTAGSVRARLTLVDCLGSRMVSTGERRVHFRGGSEEEGEEESQPLLRLGGWLVSGGWCGLKGLCFLPSDSLTLRCEIDETDDEDEVFRNEVVRPCGWRDSYLLSVPATGMPLA